MSAEHDDRDTRVDREFRAVLEGLRTTLPGVVVLFSFLLVLPLQAEFGALRGIEKGAYYVAFYGAAISTVLLIAPSAHQRLRAPFTGVTRHSERHLRFTVQLTNAGTICFAIALAAGVFLVSRIVFEVVSAVIATVLVAGLAAWAWFYVPLVTFHEPKDLEHDSDRDS